MEPRLRRREGRSRARTRPRATGSRGSSGGRRAPGAPGRAGRAPARPGRGRPGGGPVATAGSSMVLISTSMGRRRRRRASSRLAFTRSRWSQASNRSGSRSPGRSRQARTRVFWTASRASSGSRRMRRAAASSRADAARREHGKGVVIASPRPLDELPACPRSLTLAPAHGDRVRRVWRRGKPICSSGAGPQVTGTGRSGRGPRPRPRRTGPGARAGRATTGRPRNAARVGSSQRWISMNAVQRWNGRPPSVMKPLERSLGEHDVRCSRRRSGRSRRRR